ncbi:tetratricopeptide repeat protein [Mariniflexile gromovii]|uniref:Tetratricopeptide repeat protein n=1 Tax=Mariniflexile gromovii TaxID=362523 RepID=A0ABS4BX49_9FLAO|nr:tetratricopeptide repeat-containing sensor histidine kinase [Mariniflexile gromovii]MBP0904615.1 tetratricopeptide repeat protein [Mariniflexile gromovii]
MKINRLFQIFALLIPLSFIITQSCGKKTPNKEILISANDSITYFINASKNENFNLAKRKLFLLKSYLYLKKSEIDTVQVRNLSTIAFQNLKLGDTTLFKKRNEEAMAIANDLKDSFALGDLHWNYASYYNRIEVFDSAFYHFNSAYTYFDKSGHLYESAKTQYGMAYIKGRFEDYSGSEVLTFKAIEKFKKIQNAQSLYACYNHLALLQNDVQEYDRALFYYNKAIEYLNDMDDNDFSREEILHNIGNTYLKKGDYTDALNYFDKVLDNKNLKLKDINQYARVLGNKAYCNLLMKDTINVLKHLNESLRIRDSLNNKSGIVTSKILLSNYYTFKQDTVRAVNYAKEANSLAEEIKNSRDYLRTLSILAKLDIKNSPKYLEKHIQFSDSLQLIERKIQNKFTRIEYETDEYIEETERLAKQKIWIIITGIGLFLIFGLLFIIRMQKSNTEKLMLENEQQKANEQVYLITLKQQEKLEKEKVKERNRIAEELHDGILGKLFGTRVGLGFLDIQGDENLKKSHQLFLDELQVIEKEIREVSHKLSDNFDNSQAHFSDIIHKLIENKRRISNIEYELVFDDHIDWQQINEVVKVNLYRIIQESIQNIIKYASAKNVTINFSINNGDLTMTIKDDGIGFNIKRKKKGIGIKNMKSRAEKINAVFNIYSKVNEGTIIEIKIQNLNNP